MSSGRNIGIISSGAALSLLAHGSSPKVAHVLAPVLLAQPQCKGGGAAAREDADGAVGRLEPVLDVERLPGAALLVLGKGDAVVHVVVALRAQIGEPGHRAALQV